MDKKCVIIVDAELPTGLIANTAAVLSLTLGKKIDDIIGIDNFDESGVCHIGITTTPIPILKSTTKEIIEVKNKIESIIDNNLLIVDFSNVAQMTKTYEEYTQKLALTKSEDLIYLGLALYGDKKTINKLTGSMGLLR